MVMAGYRLSLLSLSAARVKLAARWRKKTQKLSRPKPMALDVILGQGLGREKTSEDRGQVIDPRIWP